MSATYYYYFGKYKSDNNNQITLLTVSFYGRVQCDRPRLITIGDLIFYIYNYEPIEYQALYQIAPSIECHDEIQGSKTRGPPNVLVRPTSIFFNTKS